ncbi:MAG: hypothetical protein EBX36_01915 [Planctomycetia bacterium]|nr:hypothetical protein [Planctomycetia bacterium]
MGRRRVGAMLAWPVVAAGLIALLVLARRDRAAQRVLPLAIERRTIRLTDEAMPGVKLPPPPAEMRQAAAELERAAEAADEARIGLERTKADLERTKNTLERQRQEFEGLRADADANAADSRQQLDDARKELDAKRQELEKASREAEERVAKARRDLEGLQQAQMGAAVQAGIAQGLGRGRGLDMKVAPDPRRVRNPALPPFVPNEAAVAAAAAAGQRGAAGQPAAGGGGDGPPAVTVQGDILRGQSERIRAEGEYAIDSSTAAINVETARAMALDNRIRTAETFFEARRINRINRAFEAGPAITLEQAVRLASAGVPPRPSALELDRSTGDIGWPRLLTAPSYADLTSRIQRHFHHRHAVGGSVDFSAAADCLSAFDELAARLRDDAGRHPAGQYGAARTFLDGLQLEYDMPLDD